MGFGLPPGGFLKSHRLLPSHHHFSILSPAHLSHSPRLGIRDDLFVGLHLISWEEGAKGPEGKSSWKKIKA
jgi:hypothetical protein